MTNGQVSCHSLFSYYFISTVKENINNKTLPNKFDLVVCNTKPKPHSKTKLQNFFLLYKQLFQNLILSKRRRKMASKFEFIKDITDRKYMWKVALKVKDK
ncbi:hypothetical protein P8452_14358 [Trifolium repens]|nr:hypothetical protein P8452_14358 [Trifolium repens]